MRDGKLKNCIIFKVMFQVIRHSCLFVQFAVVAARLFILLFSWTLFFFCHYLCSGVKPLIKYHEIVLFSFFQLNLNVNRITRWILANMLVKILFFSDQHRCSMEYFLCNFSFENNHFYSIDRIDFLCKPKNEKKKRIATLFHRFNLQFDYTTWNSNESIWYIISWSCCCFFFLLLCLKNSLELVYLTIIVFIKRSKYM